MRARALSTTKKQPTRNANGHYAGAGAAFPYSWEECFLDLKADGEPRVRVPCQEAASYSRKSAANVWVCAPPSDWSSAGVRDAPDGRYCYEYPDDYRHLFNGWKWTTIDTAAVAKLSTVTLDGQRYMCNLAPMGGDTPISAELNGNIVRCVVLFLFFGGWVGGWGARCRPPFSASPSTRCR